MFRKPTKKAPAAARQQKTKQDSSSEGEGESEVVRDALRRKRRQNPMLQTTKKVRDEDGVAGAGGALSSSDSSDGEATPQASHAFTADHRALEKKDMGATATLDIETEHGRDAQSQFERVQAMLKEGMVNEDGQTLYKGTAMYGAKEAKDTARGNASSGMNRVGPVRAPQFLRQTVRWDFAPDVCKDYKETGFCTFGDSCKFMHDRSDYKHGWEIERDWQAGLHKEQDDANYEIHSDEDAFPEECFICHGDFSNPIVTKCGHYFCERCALDAFKKSKKCRVCNANTNGVFNLAKDLIAHLSGKPKRKEECESEASASDGEGEDMKEDTKMEMLEEEGEGGEGAGGGEEEEDVKPPRGLERRGGGGRGRGGHSHDHAGQGCSHHH